MEPISPEEAKIYRSKLFEDEIKKPNITFSMIVAYSLISIVLIICSMFALTMICVADSSKPIEVCRDSLSGYTLSHIYQTVFLNN